LKGRNERFGNVQRREKSSVLTALMKRRMKKALSEKHKGAPRHTGFAYQGTWETCEQIAGKKSGEEENFRWGYVGQITGEIDSDHGFAFTQAAPQPTNGWGVRCGWLRW